MLFQRLVAAASGVAALLFLLPLFAAAQTASPPPSPVASDLTRSCTASGGCTLTCSNQQGLAVLNEQASRAIRIISLSNGNTEFRLDNGSDGINVVLVSKENLLCKLSGAV